MSSAAAQSLGKQIGSVTKARCGLLHAPAHLLADPGMPGEHTRYGPNADAGRFCDLLNTNKSQTLFGCSLVAICAHWFEKQLLACRLTFYIAGCDSGLVPAYRVSNSDPMQALREINAADRKRSIVTLHSEEALSSNEVAIRVTEI
jgi:hypothetical protein